MTNNSLYIKKRKKFLGFTINELMVTLVLIGILVAMAIPTYRHHLIKIHRTEAKVALLRLAGSLEQYHLYHHTYVGANFSKLGQREITSHETYRLEILTTSENDFQIQAVPIKGQESDKTCGAFTLNQAGMQGFTGEGSVGECW